MHAQEKGLAKVAVGMQLIRMAEEYQWLKLQSSRAQRVHIAVPFFIPLTDG